MFMKIWNPISADHSGSYLMYIWSKQDVDNTLTIVRTGSTIRTQLHNSYCIVHCAEAKQIEKTKILGMTYWNLFQCTYVQHIYVDINTRDKNTYICFYIREVCYIYVSTYIAMYVHYRNCWSKHCYGFYNNTCIWNAFDRGMVTKYPLSLLKA